MRIGFAGTPEFARVALKALLDAQYGVDLVLTQPDRPAGRGMKLQASPVKQLAVENGIAVYQPQSLKLDGRYADEAAHAQQALVAAQLDVLIVAAYGLILPKWVLDLPKYGCLNIHASLLPRWRGAAPIHRAIEAGDAQTGITIMQMDEGLDTGDMLSVETVSIAADATTASLHDQLAELGGAMIVKALQSLSSSSLRPVKQPALGITYAHKISKAESAIDWSLPAEHIERKIRAFNPFPIAQTALNGQSIKVWGARVINSASHEPEQAHRVGQVLHVGKEGIDVQCGDSGVLRLTHLQRSGGKCLPVAQWLNGFSLVEGQVFESSSLPNLHAQKAG